jgi:hypothetical protein
MRSVRLLTEGLLQAALSRLKDKPGVRAELSCCQVIVIPSSHGMLKRGVGGGLRSTSMCERS